jgi:hypothetical protein
MTSPWDAAWTARTAPTLSRSILVKAEQYEHQGSATPAHWQSSFPRTIRAQFAAWPPTSSLVTFNADGQTQHIVVNHRPRSAMLQFSQ